MRRLLEVVGNRLERCLQLGAEALDDRDDSNSDPGCDETILDGRRARLIFHKMLNTGFHKLLRKESTDCLSGLRPYAPAVSDRGYNLAAVS